MKKTFTTFVLVVLLTGLCEAQSVGVGTSSPNSSAQLDISSSSRGLLIPRMDSNAVKAIANPAPGLMVFDSSRKQLFVNMGTAAAPDWENIVAKSGWSLTGNTGTGGTAVLGTTDLSPLSFTINNGPAGILDPISGNTAFGVNAFGAAASNNDDNVAVGAGALNKGGQACIGIGAVALSGGGSGEFNIGIGFQTMADNGGTGNVAVGSYNMVFNTSGNYNTAIGHSAGVDLATGSYNASLGSNAGENNSGGNGNTAVGYQALQLTTNSFYNTAVGYNSGQAYDNGYNNVFVGANNDVNGAGYFNVIAIGQGVVCTASSQARIGNSATNSIGGYADWTNFSDVRYKKNIQEGVKGLDFIMRLRPITYNLDVTGIRNHLGQKTSADAGMQQSITAREAELLSGFAAQEVEAAATASGYDFSGVDKPKNASDFYGLRYGDFVVPLVKAVQEQQQMIIALQQKMAALEEQNKLLMELIKKQ